MSEDKKQIWTLNPARARFLFEPTMRMELSIENPYYQLPEGLADSAKKAYLDYLNKAVADQMLFEGEHEVVENKPETSGAVVDCASILDGQVNTNTLKDKLVAVCKADTQFLANGKIRSAQNDLESLLEYEKSKQNRAGVIKMIKSALSGEYGKFNGGISQIEETVEKNKAVPKSAVATPMGGDPFGD